MYLCVYARSLSADRGKNVRQGSGHRKHVEVFSSLSSSFFSVYEFLLLLMMCFCCCCFKGTVSRKLRPTYVAIHHSIGLALSIVNFVVNSIVVIVFVIVDVIVIIDATALVLAVLMSF